MATCGVSFDICRIRVTSVDVAGNVTGAAYVSDNPISVSLNPNIETGNSFSVRNGCGCSIARKKAADIFNWFEFTFNQAALEPEMMALMLGAATIDSGPDAVGMHFGSALGCDEDPAAVSFEFWTKHWVGSGVDALLPWVHWVFPSTTWQLGDNTFEEGPAQPVVTGFSQANNAWGIGPYADGPPDASSVVEGAWWKTATDPPVADCAAIVVTT